MHWILAVCGMGLLMSSVRADTIIIENGEPKAAIYADAAVMAEGNQPTTTPAEAETEKARQRLRESVKDLAGILERISGAKVPICTDEPERRDKRVRILIGSLAQKKFGEPKVSSPVKQGWRMVVSREGLGLFGESNEASSYAIYELLDRLGCRWYMPGPMGEVLPSLKTISLKKIDVSGKPGTILRDTWYRPEDFARRNRLGGVMQVGSGHCLEAYYLCHEDNIHLLKENPDAGRRFMTAYLKAARQYSQGKTERNVEIVAKYTQLDPSFLKRAAWPTMREGGGVNTDSLLDFQDWALKRKYLDKKIPADRFWDPRFVEHARKALNISSR